jgi:hypothetical protein
MYAYTYVIFLSLSEARRYSGLQLCMNVYVTILSPAHRCENERFPSRTWLGPLTVSHSQSQVDLTRIRDWAGVGCGCNTTAADQVSAALRNDSERPPRTAPHQPPGPHLMFNVQRSTTPHVPTSTTSITASPMRRTLRESSCVELRHNSRIVIVHRDLKYTAVIRYYPYVTRQVLYTVVT